MLTFVSTSVARLNGSSGAGTACTAPALAITTTSLGLTSPDLTFASAVLSSSGCLCVFCAQVKRGRSGHPRTRHRAILRTKCGSLGEVDILSLLGKQCSGKPHLSAQK